MKQKKDVLFLCQFFYPEYISSATLPYDTAEALAKHGFSVDVMCGYPKEYNSYGVVPLNEVHSGIEIRRIRYLQLKRSNFFGRLINYFSFTFFVTLRLGYLRNYKSIIVYSNPPILPFVAVLAKKFFGTKLIFVCYDIYPEIAQITKVISEGSVISKAMKWINRVVYKNVDKVVALSHEMKAYLLENRPLLKDYIVNIIPNWYENKESKADLASCKAGEIASLNSNTFIVSYFGNMGIAQDIETIIEAIRKLKDDKEVRFVFAGHGDKVKALKDTIELESLNSVTVFDFLHGQDFQEALENSDCFIVSLAKGITGLAVPSKTYGYMMAGKPIIAIIGRNSDIAKDLVANKAGFVIETGEVAEFVSAINELKNNKPKQELMGKNCRRVYLDKYTKEKCTQQYVDMMKSILEV